jgi:hypothetical protein
LISIKQTDIAEVHTFENFRASIDDSGGANMQVDLASIATNVELRDERLREFLFDTTNFPMASAALQLDMLSVDTIAVGSSAEVPVSASFDLHGETRMLDATLLVTRLSETTIQVKTTQPIVLDASDYGLELGIQKLLELAGLESISTAVPVEFMFTFVRPQVQAG